MKSGHLWKDLHAHDETSLRKNILLPLLERTAGVHRVTDIHGKNEAGLDIVFFTEDSIRTTCYGVQLKAGDIAGGARSKGSVQDLKTQIRLASEQKHPIAVEGAEEVRIDRYVIATSGNISENARAEIARDCRPLPIDFWDGHAIISRIARTYPELLSGADAKTLGFLHSMVESYDLLDALDQIQSAKKRTLTDIFEEPLLRRQYAVPVENSKASKGEIVDPRRRKVTEKLSSPSPVKSDAMQPLSVTEVLEDLQPAVFLGDQNDGKTSLLRMIALRRARSILGGKNSGAGDHVAILIGARKILLHASVEAALAAELKSLGGAHLADELPDRISRGAFLVLADGFSELFREEEKERCEKLIVTFAASFPKNRLIVTGRPEDFLQPRYFKEFRHYRLIPFSEKQVVSLARKYARELSANSNLTGSMIRRIREALQLPGSPIPAIIGVMVYDEEKRYITNTAEAVDRYMTIRLGRYAKEMGIRQEIEWSRKQDLLAEVAFGMVDSGIDGIDGATLKEKFDEIFARLGEKKKGTIVVQELVDSGVLVEVEGLLGFHRRAFRDFFAAQHLFRDRAGAFDDFFIANLWRKEWGPVLMFAAGLRRRNTDLLLRLEAEVAAKAAADVGTEPDPNHIYGAFLVGRLLTNSEASDATSRLAVLRTCLRASERTIPGYVDEVKKLLGNAGELAALMGVETTFSVTVAVPWLALQFLELAQDDTLSEEQRFLAVSAYACVADDDFTKEIAPIARKFRSLRVQLVLYSMLHRLRKESKPGAAQIDRIQALEKALLKEPQRT